MNTFFGRVVEAAGDWFVVCGTERSLRVAGRGRAGDWVELRGLEESAEGWRADEVVVVGGCLRSEFPAPGDEWMRLRTDGDRRIHNLRGRAEGMRTLRSFFDGRGFLEIEAPLLVPSPGLEVHLDAFAVEDRFLITSPEYQLKRLLAAGLDRIYSVSRCFRRRETGSQHNPEFTMAEWYRSPGGWSAIATDVEELCAEVVTRLRGSPRLEREGRILDLTPPWQRLTVGEAMQRWAGVTVHGDEPKEVLASRARAAGHRVGDVDGLTWDEVFFSVFLDAVDPHLGRERPMVLHDWPAPLCALARRSPEDPRVVERFEAYAGGLELCNGFGELVDPVEQRSRLEADIVERQRRGLPAYPIDERFLAALEEGLPPCAGVALGVDRLMMLALEAERLRDVVAFTMDEL